MAATLHPPRNDPGPSLYSRALMTDLDFKDNRYPSLSSPQFTSAMLFGASDRSTWDSSSNPDPSRRGYEPSAPRNAAVSVWTPEQLTQQYPQTSAGASADVQSVKSQTSQRSQSQDPQRSTLSYVLPPGATRRVIERYSLDDNDQRAPSRSSTDTKRTAVNPPHDDPQPLHTDLTDERIVSSKLPSKPPSDPRNQAFPAADISTSHPSNGTSPNMPLSASPSYNPPIASKHRAFPQQPTYVTPPSTPAPINTVFSPRLPAAAQEEICVECAMRDQDMADVDVSSPGVWDRESDAAFEELKRRELEDKINGVVNGDDSTRPTAKGGRLTEQNLKVWLSINPREPASRQQTLNTYLKSQRTLLEAEALAHARAMQEAKQLDNRMRDTYSQLRRSAYDLGNVAAPADDIGGVRIKPPLSPSSPNFSSHARSHSREITLLENGMIVEHVDVRKEEREARERKKKEERRARKSSRSSMMDVTSIISGQSLGPPLTDSGIGLKPYSRYSQSSSLRPTSIITAPNDRPDLPRAYSQASFSDVHSLGSASPRRSRFFGMKNLSAGWRSQDSLAPSGISGVSGSMLDMHVALQRESHAQQFPQSTIDLNTPRRSHVWPTIGQSESAGIHDPHPEEKQKKKKKGLAKIWQAVTGSRKHGTIANLEPSHPSEKPDDDLPLAPPPPLSYLVNRRPSDLQPTGNRHASAPSLPPMSLKVALPSSSALPTTGPSSSLQSPASRRADPDTNEVASGNPGEENQSQQDTIGKNAGARNVHPVISEPDMRQHVPRNTFAPPPMPSPLPPSRPPPLPIALREKSLPPLPGESSNRPLTTVMDPRPRTVYTYDPHQLPPGSSPPHDFLPPSASFRNPDVRRQSFGGVSSRPNLVVQTMPSSVDSRKSFGSRYDEFGTSRRSLGRLEHVQEHPPVPRIPVTSMKRKSKFGFSALLGKKNISPELEYTDENIVIRQSGSDGQDDLLTNGYATSGSRHSGGAHPRLSISSRKALEERVAQDPEFVAYRYPSNNQRLDLLR